MPEAPDTHRRLAMIEPPKAPERKLGGRLFGAVVIAFVVLWVGGSVAAVGMTLTKIALAVRAEAWPTAAGTVTRSRVDGCCDEARALIEYEFLAEGKTWRGDTVHPIMTLGENDARKCIAKYPAGSSVSVHYLPGKPIVSMLEPGIQSTDLGTMLIITPFMLLSLALVVGTCGFARDRRRPPERSFASINIDRAGDALTFSLREAWTAAVFGLAIGAFAGIPLIVLMCVYWVNAPAWAFAIVFLTQIAIALGLWAWKRRGIRKGHWIVAVDAAKRELRPARALNRQARPACMDGTTPFSSITGVELRERRGEDSSLFRPVVKLREGHTVVLTDWMEKDEADVFATWFRNVVDVKADRARA